MFKLLQSICEAGGGKPNEDLIRCEDSCAILLDGATSLVKTAFGADKFVRKFSKLFFDYIEKGTEVCAAANLAVEDIYSDFKAANLDNDAEYYPSAAGVFVYEKDGKIYAMGVGDCKAYFFMKNGEVVTVRGTVLDELDHMITSRLAEIRDTRGMDVCDAMKLPEIKELLLVNRKKMNTPEGYRILSFGMKPFCESEAKVFEASQVDRIVMHSDGFDHLAEELKSEGADLGALYAELRKIENEDNLLNKYPRFKISDDASAMIIKVL